MVKRRKLKKKFLRSWPDLGHALPCRFVADPVCFKEFWAPLIKLLTAIHFVSGTLQNYWYLLFLLWLTCFFIFLFFFAKFFCHFGRFFGHQLFALIFVFCQFFFCSLFYISNLLQNFYLKFFFFFFLFRPCCKSYWFRVKLLLTVVQMFMVVSKFHFSPVYVFACCVGFLSVLIKMLVIMCSCLVFVVCNCFRKSYGFIIKFYHHDLYL